MVVKVIENAGKGSDEKVNMRKVLPLGIRLKAFNLNHLQIA